MVQHPICPKVNFDIIYGKNDGLSQLFQIVNPNWKSIDISLPIQ